MALLLQDGSVFLHVPKTGGLFVTEVLEGLGLVQRRIHHIHADAAAVARHMMPFRSLQHDLQWQAKGHVPLRWKKAARTRLGSARPLGADSARVPFAAFCFVRDPLKWYESFWRYMCDHHWLEYGDPLDPLEPHPWASLRGLASHDFNEFMRNVVRVRPGYVTEMFARYTPPWVSFVGRQESLLEDLVQFLKARQMSFSEERLRTWKPANVSSPRSNAIEWDPELRLEVQRLEYAAYKRFGYVDSLERLVQG